MLVTSTTYVHAYEQPTSAHTQILIDAAVRAATSHHAGMLGVAIATSDGVLSSGFVAPSPAWSTIKVPIAIAAQRLYAQAGEDAVNTAPIRPEFSHFGQTLLSVSDEATMAGNLACLTGAAPVIALMGEIESAQVLA